ncbi:hypothetical protein [Micromonospora inositola]|uniref:Uncharacterized protein n=1 Tax=Micromonospora inositola TaxID=47865 RepID=A0A1C5I167_9ACTN|nr:hypothetical protein [Micromonospora inositola]SCG51926.1 hypothetical protein GA0070613_2106 [Micromonospora inositola]
MIGLTAEPGRAGELLVVRAPRRAGHAVLGWLVPVALGVAALLAVLVFVLLWSRSPIAAIGGAACTFLFVMFFALLPGAPLEHRRRGGRDDSVGLPMAELSNEGVRVRYRAPSLGERRTGEPADPAYDAAVAWADVTGWRYGRDPYGQSVVVVEVTGPAAVALRPAAPLLRSYLDRLVRDTGSPVAVRAPIAGPEQERAVVNRLTRQGVPRTDG